MKVFKDDSKKSGGQGLARRKTIMKKGTIKEKDSVSPRDHDDDEHNVQKNHMDQFLKKKLKLTP